MFTEPMNTYDILWSYVHILSLRIWPQNYITVLKNDKLRTVCCHILTLVWKSMGYKIVFCGEILAAVSFRNGRM